MAGASSRSSGMVPWSASSRVQPSMAPGTVTACGLVSSMRLRRDLASHSAVAPAGARPAELSAIGFLLPGLAIEGKAVAADARHLRLHDGQHGGGGDGRVDGVAAGLERLDGGQAGGGMGGGAHRPAPIDERAAGEVKVAHRRLRDRQVGAAPRSRGEGGTVTEIAARRKRAGQDDRAMRRSGRLQRAAVVSGSRPVAVCPRLAGGQMQPERHDRRREHQRREVAQKAGVPVSRASGPATRATARAKTSATASQPRTQPKSHQLLWPRSCSRLEIAA